MFPKHSVRRFNGYAGLDHDDTDCFALSYIDIKDEFVLPADKTFYGLYVLNGSGKIYTDNAAEIAQKGNQFFVAANTQIKITSDNGIKIAKFKGPKV